MNPDEARERKRLALEAERLTKDETLLKALAEVRQEALDALVSADATIPADILRSQAQVKVCDEFMTKLKTMIDRQAVTETESRVFG